MYGQAVPIGKKGKIQHQGIGRNLMKKAEEIVNSKGYEKIAVISGVGVRPYYKKLGYKLQGQYMIKNFK